MVSTEAELVVERVDRDMATTAVLVQMAVSSVLSKKAGTAFTKAIKGMVSGEEGR